MVPSPALLSALVAATGMPLAQAPASTPLLDPTHPTTAIVIVLLGLGGLLALLNQGGDFIARFRRQPPIDQDIAAVDTRLTDAVDKVRRYAGKIGTEADLKIVALRADFDQRLARLQDEAVDGRRKLHDKLDALNTSIQAEFRTLYRALGKTEGQIEDIRKGDA